MGMGHIVKLVGAALALIGIYLRAVSAQIALAADRRQLDAAQQRHGRHVDQCHHRRRISSVRRRKTCRTSCRRRSAYRSSTAELDKRLARWRRSARFRGFRAVERADSGQRPPLSGFRSSGLRFLRRSRLTASSALKSRAATAALSSMATARSAASSISSSRKDHRRLRPIASRPGRFVQLLGGSRIGRGNERALVGWRVWQRH